MGRRVAVVGDCQQGGSRFGTLVKRNKGKVVGKMEQRSKRMSAAVVDRVVQMRERRIFEEIVERSGTWVCQGGAGAVYQKKTG